MRQSFITTALLSISIAFTGTTKLTLAEDSLSNVEQPIILVNAIPGTKWIPVALNEANETVSAFTAARKGRLIAGTSAGIFISDDKGSSWKPAIINPSDKAAVFSLAIDGSGILYAGLSKYGVMVSTDNGTTWNLYSGGLNKGGPRISYAMAASGNVIIKGSLESGAYLSTDKGQNWAPCNNGIPLDLITNKMVSVNQLVVSAGTIYALTDLGVRYSTDQGKSWNKPLHSGIERLGYMTSLAAGKGFLATGVTNGTKGVFISDDNGNNWKHSGLEGKGAEALYYATDGSLYAGYKGEIFRTLDKGKTWTAVGSGLPAASSIYAIGQTPDGKLLAGLNRKGIYLLQ